MYYHRFYTADPFKPRSVEFDVWSTEDVRNLSVTAIHTHISFDGLGYPVVGGLYDPRLGPIRFNSDPCATCNNSMMKCSGHYGHIELPFAVFNPMFTAIVANLLRISCLSCHYIMIPELEKLVLVAQLKLIDFGHLVEARELDKFLSEEYSSSTPSQLKEKIDEIVSSTLSQPPNHQCRNAGDLWRFYVNKAFRRGGNAKGCFNCNKRVKKVSFYKGKLFIETITDDGDDKKAKHLLLPLDAKKAMREIWMKDRATLEALVKVLSSSNVEFPTDLCFLSAILVTPTNTRPVQIINQKPVEHTKNALYKTILLDCLQVRSIMQASNKQKNKEKDLSKEVEDVVNACRGTDLNEKLQNSWHSLQMSVNSLLDSSAVRSSANSNANINKVGLKQLVEKKQGILRKNMMGKRVDFFARSVITPDPLLSVDEIGIPDVFAKKLTFPVPVTPWNVTKLRKMVLNGPSTYPGANMVECDDGTITWISGTNAESRKGLAKTLLTPNMDSKGPKVVHRHLLDGDMLLINRQPSLHKPSIMAHKARILKGQKTFRLHYANCKAYNADFDGDEMNAHLPQGELARAEASEIVNVANQYLVPRDGTPLSGLIQDHVVAGVRLSIRGKFFTRMEYNHLVYQALSFLKDDIQLLPPTMLKPAQLWSGKQIISTIIINLTPKGGALLNLNSSAKIGFNAWPMSKEKCPHSSLQTRKEMSESNVIIRNGELLCGILDKNHVGATHYGLIHCFYELYGGQSATNLLGAFSKLCTHYQQKHGFTLGVRDILVQNKADRKRAVTAIETKSAGIEAAKSALDIPPEESIDEQNLSRLLEGAYRKNSNFRTLIDRQYKSVLDKYNNEINRTCLPGGLLELFPGNNLQLMVQSGAKGSTVNTMQISCLLGQIELEGKRPPLMISGRSLPSFRPYDCSPMAGGFIASRFMTGIQPQEFFFHCMAGREGLIDTAVKTSRSGYLQRCLVKHLEGLVVNYDLTVRDSDNSVIQFQYGEDGLDISKSQLLKKDQLQFFADNLEAFHDKSGLKSFKKMTNKDEIKERKARIYPWLENKSYCAKGNRDNGFLRFCQEWDDEVPRIKKKKKMPGRTDNAQKFCNVWNTMLHEETKMEFENKVEKCPDPVMSSFKPDVNLGSVSENVECMINDFLNEKKNELPFKKSKFKDAIYLKSFSSLCQPGEAVGVLAAQSVGEPSTQMTLNTFHFAGRGEMNVTLGIPRLREILMVASKKIKTPSMSIPFLQDVPKLEKKAEKLRRSLTKIALKDVLEKIVIKETVDLSTKRRIYTLQLHYLPRKSYSSNTTVTPKRILNYVQTKFVANLRAMLKKNVSKTYKNVLVADESKEKSRNHDETNEELDEQLVDDPTNSGDSDEDSDVEGDGDATEAKIKNRRFDTQEYDDDDEDDDKDEDEDDNENIENSDGKKLSEKHSNTNKSEPKDSDDDSDLKEEEEEDDDIDVSDILQAAAAKLAKKAQSKKPIEEEKYGADCIEHDDVNSSWSKIAIWTCLSFKKIDFSSVITGLAERAVIHQIPGIKRAFVTNNDGVVMLHTDGSYGIWELFKHDRLLDLNKLYSNDVHAVAETYGIEAANTVIVSEIQNVFKVYGITVDPRHLLLIADYMTFDGSYRPLNRTGMDSCSSPLQQMTFESTLKYLKNATIRQLKDNLQSPSSALMIGKESKIGSGLMKLYCK